MADIVAPSGAHPGLWLRLRRRVLGPPRDFRDPRVFHKMSLVAFLAWVGLGADGLSSSSYGPEQCFLALSERGDFAFLAVFLALATAGTVFLISYAYSRIIEHFPSGGGGYLVATRLLGDGAGVVSGCALLVDYVLTIVTSVAAGGEALFSLLPVHLHRFALPLDLAVLGILIALNLRGVKESVTALLPIFLVFLVTHLVLIVGGLATHAGRAGEVVRGVSGGLDRGLATVGAGGLFLAFLSAYSRGGGTYTGIEAVSNGLQIMREPRVQTGKRTMAYMAASLAFTATGILLCYLLFAVRPVEGRTMNAVLVEAFAGPSPLGRGFVFLTLASEGALLYVAAQTGFIDGPRVMANMAVDSWLPHRFASLSDRLTTQDGVLLLGGAAVGLLLATSASVEKLVVLYAINVFLTFSLSQLGMCRFWWTGRREHAGWWRHIGIHAAGFVLCAAILVVTVVEKFAQGAWLTVVITGATVALCVSVRAHYRAIRRTLEVLRAEFEDLPSHDRHGGEPDPSEPTAVLLVREYGAVGVHAMLWIARAFPGYFKNLIFVCVAVVDSGSFKGRSEVEGLLARTTAETERYVALARRLGWNAGKHVSAAVDGADEATRVCLTLAQQYPRTVFFAGRLIWRRERFYHRILHNQTAFQVQNRLQWKGLPMTVLPLRVVERRA